MKEFKGITLQPDSFAFNVACLIGAVRILQISEDESIKGVAEGILEFTQEYAEAAADQEEQ